MASGRIAARQAAQAAQDEKWKASLQHSTKKIKETKAEKGPKKKDGYALLPMLSEQDMRKAIRSIATYKPKSYNPDKQLIDFIKHLFVKYPVPYFMYQCMIKQEDNEKIYLGKGQSYRPDQFLYLHDIYREWFFCIAQGGSFQKLAKSFFTRREALLFLESPLSNGEIHINIWWAKLRAADVPNHLIINLIDKIFGKRHIFSDNGRLIELIHFFANHGGKMGKQESDEITDFIDWKLRHDGDFSYKGRTLSSMIKLSNEWHIAMQKAKLGSNLSWPGYGHFTWKKISADYLVEIVELTTNKELYAEGRKQKHCVYSYVNRCVNGLCSIFSLRMYKKLCSGLDDEGQVTWDKGEEIKRLTIEIANNSVVQVRGNLNRSAESDDKKIVKEWSGEKGFTWNLRY